MDATITIRLDKKLDRLLNQVSQLAGRTRSEIARDALRRQLAIQLYEQLRERVAPFAEAKGYLTDEDVFRDIS
ncbi:MAG: ribbon-helix-helix protein, CopG family [Gammaproteobacteria bacterium]|nr:ribbon-helix-helix protein, CopG family [Gammaproteobacteria bacterium]